MVAVWLWGLCSKTLCSRKLTFDEAFSEKSRPRRTCGMRRWYLRTCGCASPLTSCNGGTSCRALALLPRAHGVFLSGLYPVGWRHYIRNDLLASRSRLHDRYRAFGDSRLVLRASEGWE
jgi:hypothetical protein